MTAARTKQRTLTKPIKLRLDPTLMAAVQQCAAQEGLSPNEWARHELRIAARNPREIAESGGYARDLTCSLSIRFAEIGAARIRSRAQDAGVTVSAWARDVLLESVQMQGSA